jgi:hypothetical protein
VMPPIGTSTDDSLHDRPGLPDTGQSDLASVRQRGGGVEHPTSTHESVKPPRLDAEEFNTGDKYV